MAFEDDFFRESVEFSCQVSTMICIDHLSLGRIGWEYSPRLFLGSWDRWGVAQMCHRWNIFYLIWQKTTIWNHSGPICEPPPPLPFEGEVTVSVREKELDKVKTCEVKSGIICSKLTFAPNGGWTTIRNCGWSFNAGSWVSVLPCRLHHRPPIRKETWQLGTLPCEEGGVS